MPRKGDISVAITADDSDFRRKIKRFNQSMSSMRTSINRSAMAFGALGTAGGAALTLIVNNQRKAIDALAKNADALDITTEKLQALNHLAELNGVSSEQMSKGLRRMERALGEAARKGGTTADALNDAGLSIQGIINASPDQQIQKIANALGNIENQAVKVSIASDVFGRDGISMLKVLTQLRKEGIEPTTAELKALGFSLNRVDAAKVEAANDAFFRAQQVIKGAAQTLTVELAPYIEEVANQFILAAKASNGFGDEIKESIGGALRTAAKFADFVQGLKVAFKGVELVAVGFGAAAVSSFQLAIEAIVVLQDTAREIVNSIITDLNKIPGVEIAKVDLFTDSKFMEGLRGLGDAARNHVGAVRTELHNLAMQEMPSEKVEAFLQTVKEKADLAAESVAKVTGNNIEAHTGDFQSQEDKQGGGAGFIDFSQDEMGFMGHEDPFLNPESILEKQEQMLELDRQFWTNKGAVAQHGLNAITGMVDSSYGKQAGAVANSFATILSATATHSKKAFELNKKASLAQAAVKGWDAAQSAWAAGMSTGGPWAPFVAAAFTAASLAKTGAQIKAIKSQKFGGGGSTSAGGGTGGASGALPGASVPQQSNAAPAATMVNMTVQGDSLRANQFGSITEQLNKEFDAGYKLNVQFA